VASPPEPLRLFDPDQGGVEVPSRPASAAVSVRRTRRQPSVDRTEAPTVRDRDTGELLRRVAERAKLLDEARCLLDEAIGAARAAGHSWRTIGIHARIPDQTLHQRSRTTGATPNQEA